MLKRIGEIFLVILTVLGLPAIIQLASAEVYELHSITIWIATGVLAVLISFTQLNFSYSPKFNRLITTVRFYIFKTNFIALFLTLQISTSLFISLSSHNVNNSKLIFISFGINLLALNLLVLFNKLVNTDSKELIFHRPDGRMYIYANNQLRHIPDPPTFELLGLSWADAIDLNEKQFSSYKISSPITSLKDMKLINYRGRVYGLVNEKLKHVPNPPTLQFILQHRTDKQISEVSDIDEYEIDKPFAGIR